MVDDHASAREAVATCCAKREYVVATCASASEALAKLAGERFDVVVTDLQMPGMNGLEFICEIERRRLDVQVLMITAHASVSSAVEAMRHGAFDYIEKPFDAIALERSVAQACDRARGVGRMNPPACNGRTGFARGTDDDRQQLRDASIARTDCTSC